MGGEGSGRHTNPLNVYYPTRVAIAQTSEGNLIELPNVSAVKEGDNLIQRQNVSGAGWVFNDINGVMYCGGSPSVGGTETDPIFMSHSGALAYVLLAQSGSLAYVTLAQSGSLAYVPLTQSGAYFNLYSGSLAYVTLAQSGALAYVTSAQSGALSYVTLAQSGGLAYVTSAQSGSLAAYPLKAYVETLSGGVVTLSGASSAHSVSGAILRAQYNLTSGAVITLNTTLSGAVWVTSGACATTSGSLATLTSNYGLTSGQVATLNTTLSGATWVNSGALATLSGAVATKGKLLTYSGTAHFGLPIGSNNQVLTADSAEGAGMKWSGAAGGGGTTVVAANSKSPMTATFGTTSTSYVNITGLSGSVVTSVTSTIMGWLNDATWNSTAGGRSWFQINIDGTASGESFTDNVNADSIDSTMIHGIKTGVTAGTIYVIGQAKVTNGTANFDESSDNVTILAVGA